MKLKIDKVKARKATSEMVRPVLRHEDPRRKSRANEKRSWQREVREAIY